MHSELYYNGTIITMNPACPAADALLVQDGVIKAAGSTAVLSASGSRNIKKIDLQNHTLIPGFIDSHSHITAVAYQLLMCNVSPSENCDSVDSLLLLCKEYFRNWKRTKDEWFIATGFDTSGYSDETLPDRYDLDRISNTVPVIIVHASGHMAVVNSTALELLGYTGNFLVPEGGIVETFPDTGQANGVIKERAFLDPEIQSKIVPPPFEKVLDSLDNAQKMYASYGITTAQDARTGLEEYYLLQAASRHNRLFLDIVSYTTPEIADSVLLANAPDYENRNISYNNHYRFGGFKTFLDGSPQAKTAWLTKPYRIPPEGASSDYCGFPVLSDSVFTDQCVKCLENRWQINVHCNGDAACDQMIRCYEKALKITGVSFPLRPVMIHAQTVRTDQLDKMAKAGISPSYFSDHVYYWGDYHLTTLGKERAEKISPLRSTLERNIPFTIHQDSPVIKPDMIFSLYNSVKRMTKKGHILGQDQCLSPEEALKALTLNGAYQIFEEDKKGSLMPGKKADFCILDRNPLTAPTESLKDISVLATYKEGNCIYNI